MFVKYCNVNVASKFTPPKNNMDTHDDGPLKRYITPLKMTIFGIHVRFLGCNTHFKSAVAMMICWKCRWWMTCTQRYWRQPPKSSFERSVWNMNFVEDQRLFKLKWERKQPVACKWVLFFFVLDGLDDFCFESFSLHSDPCMQLENLTCRHKAGLRSEIRPQTLMSNRYK